MNTQAIKPRTPVEHVGSGSFSVSGRRNLRLEACLGSCVGIALVDRTANVGGLIHLLLPTPLTEGSAWQPEIYASTGLPLFMEALQRLGAREDRLEAIVAGGALVGRIEDRDLILDIGGRTTDIVMATLKQRKISLAHAETGGLYSMTLTLDLNSWECAIQPLIQSGAEAGGPFTKPSVHEMEMAIGRIRPIPQMALKIVRMIGDSNYNLQDVAAEARQDQVIAARVLHLANSALINWQNRVESVDEALMVLGEKMLLRLVVSASMEGFFTKEESGYAHCRGGLYYHALGTAVAAETLARISGKAASDVAYTAGLLHDIGKVVLDRFVIRNFPFFYRKTQVDLASLEDTERELLGLSHGEAGERLALLWDIPENLREAIGSHHNPGAEASAPELVAIVYLADLIVNRFWLLQELKRQNAEALASSLALLGLEPKRLPDIINSIPWPAMNSLRS